MCKYCTAGTLLLEAGENDIEFMNYEFLKTLWKKNDTLTTVPFILPEYML